MLDCMGIILYGEGYFFCCMLILFGQHGKHFLFCNIMQCPAFVIGYTYIVGSFYKLYCLYNKTTIILYSH